MNNSEAKHQIIDSIKNLGEQHKTEIEALKTSQEEIKKEIKKIVRQDYKLTTEFQTNTESAQELNKQLCETQKLINDSLKTQLEQIKIQQEELIQQRQENGILQGDIKKWQEFAVTFFENLERILELQKETSEQIVEKIIKDFDRFMNPFGLERVAPSSGDDLNEELHQANEEKESSDIEPGKVLECKKWGYKINGKLYQDKRAEVILAKTPDKLSDETSLETSEVYQKQDSNIELCANVEQPQTSAHLSEDVDNSQEFSNFETDEITTTNQIQIK
jgi:molecular chaperone GrpE (heat shock protein)